MPAGSYRNSIDGLLSSLIDLSKRLAPMTTTFDIKYLKRLISILLASFNSANASKNRTIFFKYNIERFVQLICSIHIHPEDLSDILAIVHHLLHYECQPIRLSTNTLLHLFKAWMTNPNFLCSSLIGKDLFMEQFLAIIVRRLSVSIPTAPNSITDNPLILTTTNNIGRKSSFSLNENDTCLQNVFLMLLNLISYSQTCVQIQSVYRLIITFLNHTSQDIVNHDLSQLPLLFLCSQVKLIHPTLLYPFINLFTMVHTVSMITRTKDILSQISSKRLSSDLCKHFLSIEKSKTSVRSLRHVSTKHLYHHLQKPYIDSVKSLPIGDALKERLLHFHDIWRLGISCIWTRLVILRPLPRRVRLCFLWLVNCDHSAFLLLLLLFSSFLANISYSSLVYIPFSSSFYQLSFFFIFLRTVILHIYSLFIIIIEFFVSGYCIVTRTFLLSFVCEMSLFSSFVIRMYDEPMYFFVRDRERVRQANVYEWLNALGQNLMSDSWTQNLCLYNWFDKTQLRRRTWKKPTSLVVPKRFYCSRSSCWTWMIVSLSSNSLHHAQRMRATSEKIYRSLCSHNYHADAERRDEHICDCYSISWSKALCMRTLELATELGWWTIWQ